jgi:hypothetical protein
MERSEIKERIKELLDELKDTCGDYNTATTLDEIGVLVDEL